MRVLGANGQVKLLSPVTLKRLDLGSARFEGVRVLEHDLADLSNHLGVRIDGVLGFPLFRDTLLTLDYLHSQVIITPQGMPMALPGVTIPFNNEQNTPLIPIQLGNESFIALIDSGSDAALSLNTVGLHPTFRFGPKPGALVATLAGDRLLMTGRLDQTLTIGAYAIEYPVVDLTDELSSIGGGLLRDFAVTFDQKRNQATFYRPTYDPVKVAARPQHRPEFHQAARVLARGGGGERFPGGTARRPGRRPLHAHQRRTGGHVAVPALLRIGPHGGAHHLYVHQRQR